MRASLVGFCCCVVRLFAPVFFFAVHHDVSLPRSPLAGGGVTTNPLFRGCCQFFVRGPSEYRFHHRGDVPVPSAEASNCREPDLPRVGPFSVFCCGIQLLLLQQGVGLGPLSLSDVLLVVSQPSR